MKILSIMTVLMVSLLTVNVSAQSDEAIVEKIARAAVQGYHDKDVNAMVADATDNVVIAGPFNEFIVGKEAVIGKYTAMFQTFLKQEKGELIDTQVIMSAEDNAQVLMNLQMHNSALPDYENQALVHIHLIKTGADWKISAWTVILNPHQTLVDMTKTQR